MAEEFELVRNANAGLVDGAQANVGVPFKGENEIDQRIMYFLFQLGE